MSSIMVIAILGAVILNSHHVCDTNRAKCVGEQDEFGGVRTHAVVGMGRP